MGYVLRLWAAPVDELEQQLRPWAVGGARGQTTNGAATGGGDAEQAVESWLSASGQLIDTVDHTSSAGEWFRDEVVGGLVADRFGSELAEDLLSRPVAGVDWREYPSVGWVRNAELRAAVGVGTTAPEPAADTEEGEAAQIIIDAVLQVLTSGQDLVTYYS